MDYSCVNSKNILLSCFRSLGQSLPVLEDGPVAKFILVLCLYRAGSLGAELSHSANQVHSPRFLQLSHAIVNGAVCPTAANPGTAVDHHGWALLGSASVVDDVLRGIPLLWSHDCDQLHHLGPTQGDTVVRPCCELEVGHHMLAILQRRQEAPTLWANVWHLIMHLYLLTTQPPTHRHQTTKENGYHTASLYTKDRLTRFLCEHYNVDGWTDRQTDGHECIHSQQTLLPLRCYLQ